MTKTAIFVVPDDEGLRRLFGVPAVRRLTAFARQLGVAYIHVVGRVDPLLPVLKDLASGIHFHPAEDVASVKEIIHNIDVSGEGQVLVMRVSHVIDRLSLARFMEKCKDHTACSMVPENGRASEGIYLVPRELLPDVVEMLWSGYDGNEACLEGIHSVTSIAGFPGLIRGEEDVDVLENKLVAALSAHTKADDGFMARHFDRRISQRISKKLAHTSLVPNQITLMGVSIGMLGAFLLSMGGYWLPLLGSFLFVFCVIVDGVDGEVARLKLKESVFGHYLDITTDNMVHVAIFVGIGFGLYNETGNRAYLWMLWLMLGGFALCILAVYQCILRLSSEEMERSPMTLRAMALLSNRDFAYLIALLALFGKLEWFLIGASVGSYLFAVGLWVIRHKEKSKHPVSSP